MNKTELIDAIAQKSKLTKSDSKKALEAVLAVISEQVKKGDKVALIGFGTFGVSARKARQGINPRTKQPIKIAAKKSLKFKPSAQLSNL